MIYKLRGTPMQERVLIRLRNLAYGILTCLGRQTVSGFLTASGQQFVDWSAAYKIFSQSRVSIDNMFEISKQAVIEETCPEQMLVAHMDDTILKKTGKKIPGAAWRRDPLGPKFQNNFIWGQRFIQLSMALPSGYGPAQSRAIPVDFHHCPTAKRPGKNATQDEKKTYRELQKQYNLSIKGVERITSLRESLDVNGAKQRELYLSVDGSYTNRNVIKNLPSRVTLIGRIRKDTRLHKPPEHSNINGRTRLYGDKIPTPEEIRQDNSIEWQQVNGWAAGKEHTFSVKTVKDLRWECAGGKRKLQLVVIKPLGYRLSKNSRLIFREPAYLICTDSELDIEKLLQAYLWRWEIEVNIREEKTLFGSGKAQVRNEHSVESVPAFITAIYSYLLLAAQRAYKQVNSKKILPRPKWYPAKNEQRITTGDLLNLIRTELWAKALGCESFPGFVKQQHETRSRKNYANPLSSALFYLRK